MKDLTPLLSWLRLHLARLYGSRLDRIVLYGSHARGDARPGSDVDVALVLSGTVDPVREVDRTAGLVADAVLGFGLFVSIYPVSVSDFEMASRPIVRSVREEGVPA